ncbi:hypothetical protein EOL96_02920 [Candidatus Saccharibacteria bacterium]|nr:hypothetical protein [Candidatus Saccharibacteria bacterium]
MAKEILALAERNETTISAWRIIKSDIFPWVASAGFSLLFYLGVEAMLRDANPNIDDEYIGGALYTWGRYFLWALLMLAVFASRRSKDIWTWVLSAILIFVFLPQYGGMNLAISILPNSILYPLLAMLGLLATGRLVEYLRIRYLMGIKEPRLSIGATTVYIIMIAITVLSCSSIVYDLVFSD